MQMRLLAFAALILTAACQPMPEAPSGPVAGERCHVTVSFGSVCCGVDQATRARILAYVEHGPYVGRMTEHPWGREGESDLCLRTISSADPDVVVREIAALIPARTEGSSTGTTTVRRGE